MKIINLYRYFVGSPKEQPKVEFPAKPTIELPDGFTVLTDGTWYRWREDSSGYLSTFDEPSPEEAARFARKFAIKENRNDPSRWTPIP